MKRRVATIIGLSGSGKTTLANLFVKYRQKPVLIVDLFNQFEGKRFFTAAELLDYIISRNGLIEISTPLILQTYEMEDFKMICEIAKRYENLTLVIDEVDFFDNPRSQDRTFKELIHLGRHYDVDIISTSRRPASISRDLTSQTHQFYIFRVTEGRDLHYFKELHSDLPDLIRDLKPFHYVRYLVDRNNIQVRPPVPKWK